MSIFVFGLLLVVGGLGAVLGHRLFAVNAEQRMLAMGGGVLALLLGLGTVVWSTAIYVDADKTGVIEVKFGADLPPGAIIATQGEKGPQAKVLPPGWHFFYWPWIYDLQKVETIDIPQGKLGVVTAKDGKPLPPGEVFASKWSDAQAMLDAQNFLSSGKGHKGPQLTELLPGQYRYNPRLFNIEMKPALTVDVGRVAVIKANAGPIYTPVEGEKIIEVNGTPIVPKDFRGIWNQALGPNIYNQHPDAYEVTMVQTTNRIYEFAHEKAIAVRTKDGFEFPVDVRVSVKISAENAPFVVAKLADPDGRSKDSKSQVLEEVVILPLVRAILRNTAEGRNALEFVNQRSAVEKLASEKFAQGLGEYRVETDGVYLADIRIGETEAGRRLLTTQTDREVAQQEQQTFQEKQRAQESRATAVRAEEEANQQADQARARSRVLIAQEDAKALIAQAEGEAESYRKKMEALGGVQNFIAMEVARLAMAKWEGSVPRVFTVGGEGGAGDPTKALMGVMLERMMQQEEPAKPVQSTQP